MKELNDYFRLKEIDRLEAEKQCLITLKKVIDICIKKDYNFNIHSSDGASGINVTTDGWANSFSSYFKGSLINYSDETGTLRMVELLEKLRKTH